MRLPSILSRSFALLLASIAITNAAESKYSETLTLSYEYVADASSKPSPLAIVNYDPSSLRYTLSSWTPPTVPESSAPSKQQSAPLLRILASDGSSTVTTLSTFDTSLKQHLNIYLSTLGAPLSASVTSVIPVPPTAEEVLYQKKVERAKARGKPIPPRPKPEKPKKPKKGTTPKVIPVQQPVDDTPEGQPRVTLRKEQPGPSPKLLSRAPPVVDEEGNEVVQPEQVEKSFFQKYWWVIAGVVLMTTLGGGGDK